jgi:hypothetical protein
MSDESPSLFNNLSLRHWYKYLLYVAGVLLILGVVFGVKITSVEVVPFSFWTIVLMTILWIYDEVIILFSDRYNKGAYVKARMVIHSIFFLLWILVAATTLF